MILRLFPTCTPIPQTLNTNSPLILQPSPQPVVFCLFILLMLIFSNCFISTADAYGCRIEVNSDTALAKPNNQQQQGYSTYSCTPSSSSTQYEVHVLSVYEVINRRPPTAGNANVNIVSRGLSNRPIVLVLASYEPVNWILNLPTGISISKVILVSTFAHHELKGKKNHSTQRPVVTQFSFTNSMSIVG